MTDRPTPRTQEWTRNGGKTHRVVITSDEPVSSLTYLASEAAGRIGYDAANAAQSSDWLVYQAKAAMNCQPGFSVDMCGALGGIFGGLF